MKTTSYQWGGLPGGTGVGNGSVRVGSVTEKYNNKSNTYAVRRNNTQNSLIKKRLNYNPREIRNALLLARESQSAGRVACQARSKLSSLLRCKGTGMYNESELSNAIVHARQMVRVAQTKKRNLKEEEQLQKRYADQAKAEKQKAKREIKHKVQQKKRVLEQKVKMEKLQRVRRQKQHEEEIIRKRRMNRLAEQGKMDEADMEYKRNQNRDSNRDSSWRNHETYYFSAEGVEMELSEDAIMQSEEQLEQQLEMMLQAELAMAVLSVTPDAVAAPVSDFVSAESGEAVEVAVSNG